MKDFYEKYYAKVDTSKVHAIFCEKVFGINLCQHGFADVSQLKMLVQKTEIQSTDKVLDVGCGNGRIPAYLSEKTKAQFTGIDFISEAIAKARQLPGARDEQLSFIERDINKLDLPPKEYDVVLSIDSIYFSSDYQTTIAEFKNALRDGGRMGFLYSYGREPWVPKGQFPKEMLPSDKTPLAEALEANMLIYTTVDFTDKEYELAIMRKKVLNELKEQFEEDDIMFIYENRMGDANGIMNAIEEGLQKRYLYFIRMDGVI